MKKYTFEHSIKQFESLSKRKARLLTIQCLEKERDFVLDTRDPESISLWYKNLNKLQDESLEKEMNHSDFLEIISQWEDDPSITLNFIDFEV